MDEKVLNDFLTELEHDIFRNEDLVDNGRLRDCDRDKLRANIYLLLEVKNNLKKVYGFKQTT